MTTTYADKQFDHFPMVNPRNDEAAPGDPRPKQIVICYQRHWITEAQIIEETEKAYKLRRVGSIYDTNVGSVAWMPKKALKPSKSCVTGEILEDTFDVARWFKPNRWQEKFLGLAE